MFVLVPVLLGSSVSSCTASLGARVVGDGVVPAELYEAHPGEVPAATLGRVHQQAEQSTHDPLYRKTLIGRVIDGACRFLAGRV
ncbi:hypothetical protein ACFWCA_02895 [Streptomyces phaeochromogenes]|uniref:hypothetical protein n=1 Tax=Streptomyces phaeochromogenes TaxID=1923 RepID=UPI003693ECE0